MDTPNNNTEVVDEFAAAFSALTEPVAAPVADPAAADPVVAAADPAVAPATDPAAADPVVAAADPAAVPVVETPAPAAVPDPATDRIAALEAEIAALKNATPAAPATPPAAETPPEAAPVYTADEQAVVDKYLADWPDVVAGEALVRRAEYRNLVSYIFDQVRSQLDPALEFYQRQQGRTQYSDIVALVPDYDEVRDKTLAWVDTQPEYLKKAYQEVANSGSAADVADLIARYKRESGYVAPAAVPAAVAPAAAAPAAPAAPNLAPAAAAAVTNLKVVKSSRSEPTTPADPNNFDAAFDEFANANAR